MVLSRFWFLANSIHFYSLIWILTLVHFIRMPKKRGFVLCPGKISKADTFRIGSIGGIYLEDIRRLISTLFECFNKRKRKKSIVHKELGKMNKIEGSGRSNLCIIQKKIKLIKNKNYYYKPLLQKGDKIC